MGNGSWKLDDRDFRAAGLSLLMVCVAPAIWASLTSPGVGSHIGAPFHVVAVWAVIFYLYSIGFSGAVAFPMLLVLNRLRLLHVAAAPLVGLLTGGVVLLLVAPSQWSESGPYFVAAGGVLGLAFWPLFAYLKRG